MRHFLVPLALVAAIFSTSAAAQQAVQQQASPLEPGARVRVVLARQSRSAWGPRQVLQGTIARLDADSLTLQLDAGATPVTVEMTSIARLDVSLGVPSPLQSAVLQGVLGAGAGVLYWPVLDTDGTRSDSPAKAALIGAGVGAAAGALFGALRPQEQWQRVRLVEGNAVPAAMADTLPPARIALGGGFVAIHNDRIGGVGQHALATIRLAELPYAMQLRGELLYGSAEGRSGTPFSCSRMRQYGAGLSIVRDLDVALGPFRPYSVPIGLGVYHRRTATTEHQGPTGICFSGGESVPCSDNPPFETIRYDTTTTGLGVNSGFGLQARVGPANAFAEVRLHMVLERGSYTGSLPLTFGLSF